MEERGEGVRADSDPPCHEAQTAVCFVTIHTVQSTVKIQREARVTAGLGCVCVFVCSYRHCGSHLETMHKDSHMGGSWVIGEREGGWHKLGFTL